MSLLYMSGGKIVKSGGGLAASGGLPLLQSSAFTYLGVFQIPGTVNSIDTTFSTMRGFAHDTVSGSAPRGVIYMNCVGSNALDSFAVAIPTRAQIANWATTMTQASAVRNPVAFSNLTGAPNAAAFGNTGVMDYSGQLIFQQAVTYDGSDTPAGGLYSHGKCSYDMSSITAMLPPRPSNWTGGGQGYGVRHVNGQSAQIPSAWQSSLGGDSLAFGPVRSTYQDCPLGIGLYSFNGSDVISGVSPFSLTCLMDHQFYSSTDFSRALGGLTPQNGWRNGYGTVSASSGSSVLTVSSFTTVTASGLWTGATGVGPQITTGAEGSYTASGLPVGATITSQLTGPPGGAGTYQMDMNATGNVSGGFCAIGDIDNNWMRADNHTFGPIFPSNSRTIAFISNHGTGVLAYKDPTYGSNGNTQYPYKRRMIMFDANDALLVKAGGNPWAPVPYAYWDMDVPGSLLPTGSTNSDLLDGACYDDAPLDGGSSLLFVQTTSNNTGVDFASYVHVWTVSH